MHALLLALILWGPPLDGSGQPAAPPPAVVTKAAAAPETVQPLVPAWSERARTRWLQEQLYARDGLYFNVRTGVAQGGRAVDTADAYLIVGRPDLASKVRDRRATKGALRDLGLIAVTLGLVVGVADAFATSLDNGWDDLTCGSMCAHRSQASPLPWIVAFGGGVAAITGIVIPEDPLDSAQKARLIDDYNRRLRAGLGLSF